MHIPIDVDTNVHVQIQIHSDMFMFEYYYFKCSIIIALATSTNAVPALESECHIFWKYMYWVTIAISFIVSFNAVLNTVYICVYGQGMAIRGPQGSMVKAVEGFDIEQDQVMISFVIAMIFTALSTAATYWIMMDSYGAILACTITLIGFYYWYKHAIRIYNRFKWDKDDQTSWHRGSDEQPRYVLEHKAYHPPIQQEK
jgi:hypothetical protein